MTNTEYTWMASVKMSIGATQKGTLRPAFILSTYKMTGTFNICIAISSIATKGRAMNF